MAIAKDAATRASVTPRLKASAPERASVDDARGRPLAARGSSRGPASCEPANQTASMSASEASRSATIHSLGPAV